MHSLPPSSSPSSIRGTLFAYNLVITSKHVHKGPVKSLFSVGSLRTAFCDISLSHCHSILLAKWARYSTNDKLAVYCSPTTCWQRWMKKWMDCRQKFDSSLAATNQLCYYPIIIWPFHSNCCPAFPQPATFTTWLLGLQVYWIFSPISVDVTSAAIGATLNWIVGVSSALNSGKFSTCQHHWKCVFDVFQ
jgi:hypothetical protein